MATPFHPIPILATVVLAVLWTLAILVYRARPRALQNRALAVLLFTMGFSNWMNRGFRYFWDEPDVALASLVAGNFAGLIVISAYVILIGTLDTRWKRWLSHTGFRLPLIVFLLGVGVVYVIEAPRLASFERFPHLPAWSVLGLEDGTSLMLISALGATTLVLSTVVALLAIRDSRAESARRTARGYAAAFILNDMWNILIIILINFPNWADSSLAGNWFMGIGPLVETLIFAAILAYAMLRNHMFGVELRLKWTISRGTVATIFLGVFTVVTLAASEWLVDRFGYLFGAAAAGALLLAIRPLQRAGERIADAAMPNVNDTPEYRSRRSKEIYQAAFEAAMVDGLVTGREKDALAVLQEQLGLKPTEARAIERHLVA